MEIPQDFYDFFDICRLPLRISQSFLMIWPDSMPMARPGPKLYFGRVPCPEGGGGVGARPGPELRGTCVLINFGLDF